MTVSQLVAEIKSAPNFVPPFVVADPDGLDLAVEWGKEDALNGTDRRGSMYFVYGTLYHRAYNEGYDAGTEQRAAILGRTKALGLAAVQAEFASMPADFAAAVQDVERHGIRYCPAGIDWAAVEDSGVGA